MYWDYLGVYWAMESAKAPTLYESGIGEDVMPPQATGFYFCWATGAHYSSLS